MSRQVHMGDRVVRMGAFHTVFDLTALRVGKTISTKLTRDKMDFPFGERMSLDHFRFYDEVKVKRIEELVKEIHQREQEMGDIWRSLETLIL